MFNIEHKSRFRYFTYLCLMVSLSIGLGVAAKGQTATTAARPDRGIRPNGSYAVERVH